MGASLVLPVIVFIGVFAVATVVLMARPREVATAPPLSPIIVPAPEPAPVERAVRIAPPPAARDQHFRGCRDAHAAGRYSIPSWDPSYRDWMDGDGDGLACEPIPMGQRAASGRVTVLH